MKKTLILHAAQLATPQGNRALRGAEMGSLSVVSDGAVAVVDGIIVALGPTDDVLRALGGAEDFERVDASGQCLLPGFVDSHTHLVFGGYRPGEFFDRLSGRPYLEILRQGGGIQSTVRSTRSASLDELLESALGRLDDMLAQGVTCAESKSGYGLDLETELRQLEVGAACRQLHPTEVVSTYLGAHAVPPEFAGRAEAYVDFMIETVLPAVKGRGLADFCDVFCEDSVFSVEESRKLLEAAARLGFGLKMHADEMVPLGGAELACELGAASADHLLAVSPAGVKRLSESATVATLLPCTAFCMKKPFAPARRMIDAGCAVALATDFNPGSCFTNSVPLLLSLAVLSMGMTAEEAVTALTLNGAAALGRAETLGSLEPGKRADLVFLKYPDYRFLFYHTGVNIVARVMKDGQFRMPGDRLPR